LAQELISSREEQRRLEEELGALQLDRQEILSSLATARAELKRQDATKTIPLEASLASVRAETDAIRETLAGLQEARDARTVEITDVRNSIADQRLAAGRWEAAYQSLLAATDRADIRIAALREDAMVMKAGRDGTSAAIAMLNQAMQEVGEAGALATSERSNLKSTLEAARERIGELQDTIEGLQAESKSLSGELAESRQALQDQRQINEQSKATSRSLISEQVWVRNQLAALADEIKAAALAVDGSNTDRADLGRDLVSQREAISVAARERRRLESDLASANSRLDLLQTASEESEKGREALDVERARVRRDIEDQREALEATESRHARLERELTEARESIDAMRVALVDSEEAQGNLGRELVLLGEAVENQRTASLASGGERGELLTGLDGVTTRVAAFGETLNRARIIRDNQATAIAALEQELKDMQGAHDQTVAENSRQAAGLAAVEAQLGGQKQVLIDSRAAREEQNARMRELGRALQTQQETVVALESERIRLSEDLAAAQKQIDAVLVASNAVRNDLGNGLAQLRKVLEDQARVAEAASVDRKELISDVDGVGTRVAALGETLDKVKIIRDDQRTAISTLQLELGKLRTVLGEAATENSLLAAELATVKEQVDKQRQDLAGSQAARAKQDAKLLELGEAIESQREKARASETKDGLLEADLASAREQIDAVVAASQAVMDRVERDLTRMRGTIEDQSRLADGANAGQKQLMSGLDAVSIRVASLGETLNKLRVVRDNQKAGISALNREMENIREARGQAVTESGRLAARLAAVEEELGRQQQILTDSRAEQQEQDAKVVELGKTLETQREQANASETIHGRLKADLADTREQMDAVLKASQAVQSNLVEELARLAETLEGQSRLADKSHADRKDLMSGLDGVSIRVASLGETLSKVRTIRDNQKAEISALYQELEDLRETHRQTVAENSRLTVELAAVRKQVDNQRQVLVGSQAAQDKRDRELVELQEALQSQQGILRVSETQRLRLKTDLASAREQIDAVLKDSQASRETLEGGQAATGEQILALRGDLDSDLRERKQLNSELAELREELTIQRRATDRSNALGKALESDLKSASERILALEAVSDVLRESGTPRPTGGMIALRKPGMDDARSPDRVSSAEVALGASDPRPEPRTADGASRQTADLSRTGPFLRSWLDAWQQKDIDAYLSHYSPDFQPSGGITRGSWIARRRQRLRKPAFIEVKISDSRTESAGDLRARIMFNQHYRSDTYRDEVFKTLELRWEADGWKILREASRSR